VALQTSEANESHAAVAAVVSRINSRFATLTYTPVVFLHLQDLTFAQYLVADAFLVTSVREGMALRAHEYVECQEKRRRPLILSEVCGLPITYIEYT
jgi:trehalose-6-phosphate synthase